VCCQACSNPAAKGGEAMAQRASPASHGPSMHYRCTARPAFRRSPWMSESASGEEDVDKRGRRDRVCMAMRGRDERIRLPAQRLPCLCESFETTWQDRGLANHDRSMMPSLCLGKSVTILCVTQLIFFAPDLTSPSSQRLEKR